MTESTGRIFAACVGGELLLRFVGRASAHHCPALRRYAEDCLSAGAKNVLVYLGECSHLDSTCVGTLVFLAKRPELKPAKIQLRTLSPECQRILKQMAVLPLFQLVEGETESPSADWQELVGEGGDSEHWAFKQNVVDAHEHLAAVPSPLSERFKDIAESCRRELAVARSNGPRSS